MSCTESQQNRRPLLLAALCGTAYFISYLSRINLSACMVELVASGYAEKATVALALSVNAIVYGAGQLFSGWLGDRCSPQNVTFLGFLLTAAMNICVALLPDARFLVPIWAVNGFAQALVWPPMLRIMTCHLQGDSYTRACKWVCNGSAFANIALYVGLPVLLRFTAFRTAFIISSAAAFAMALLWKALCDRYFPVNCTASADVPQAASAARLTRHALFLMLTISLAIALMGALRDGVINWLPTLLGEAFHLESSAAILTGALLPVFQILCIQLISWVHRRFLRNELFFSGLLFGLAIVAGLLLQLAGASHLMLTVLLFSILVAAMHGVSFLLTTMAPAHYLRFGHVSFVSGFMNASAYIGNALSTYGIAMLALGLTSSLWFWAIAAGAGLFICLGIARMWQRF